LNARQYRAGYGQGRSLLQSVGNHPQKSCSKQGAGGITEQAGQQGSSCARREKQHHCRAGNGAYASQNTEYYYPNQQHSLDDPLLLISLMCQPFNYYASDYGKTNQVET